jgi:hypothetical protein
MERRAKLPLRRRPKLPKAPGEMQQWSQLLLDELLGWPEVRTRPLFGMTAVYRGNAIFGALPKTRAMDTPYSVSFKIPRRTAGLKKKLKDPRILNAENQAARWLSFELQSGDDLPDALSWFAVAYRLA